MEVAASDRTKCPQARHQLTDLPGHADADGVGEDDLGRRCALHLRRQVEYACRRDAALERTAKGRAQGDDDAQAVLARAPHQPLRQRQRGIDRRVLVA